MKRLSFAPFATSVNTKFLALACDTKVVPIKSSITGDQLFEMYLKAFPSELNSIFRVREHYNGSYDKNYIRRLGNVVFIKEDNTLDTIWNINVEGYFQQVADALHQALVSAPLSSHFLTKESNAGSKPNKDNELDITWTHFYSVIPSSLIQPSHKVSTILGDLNTEVQMLQRAVSELTLDSFEIVMELIESNSIYRGQEHLQTVKNFYSILRLLSTITDEKEKLSKIYYITKTNPGVSRFRNSVIGTLITDISKGDDVEQAVKSFESKVAPMNYKRSSALVTPRMIEDAKKKLEDADLLDSLDRRFATASDLDINDVLFTYVPEKSLNIFDDLSKDASKQNKTMKTVEEISFEDFVTKVVPTAKQIDVLLENRHQANMMTLLTSANQDSKNIMKWSNPFSWSYNGDITDSIKEKVKKAGGNVEGYFRVSLAWSNADDLDLSLQEVNTGTTIYFGRRSSPQGGHLDIDANGGSITDAENPVENIYYSKPSQVKDGIYYAIVNNFNKRSRQNVGFTLQVEFNGTTHNFAYEKDFNLGHTKMLKITIKGTDIEIENLDSTLKSTGDVLNSKEFWNVKSNTYVPVTHLLFSPNYWKNNAVGNKHLFFILEDCKTNEATRGFYNEFLTEDLNSHRKVIELLTSKTKVDPADTQLSGLGISSTKTDKLTVRVKGKTQRQFVINF